MGYQERRTWILLVSQVVTYGAYFWALRHGHVRLNDTLFIVIGSIVLQIVLQAGLAAITPPQKCDERDIAIERRAYRVGYFTLTMAVVVLIGMFVYQLQGSLPLASFVVNALLFVMGLAEIAKLTAQIGLYRRWA